MGESDLVDDAVRRGSAVAEDDWLTENYLNDFAFSCHKAGSLFCENELQASDFRLKEDHRTACQTKPKVGRYIAKPGRWKHIL